VGYFGAWQCVVTSNHIEDGVKVVSQVNSRVSSEGAEGGCELEGTSVRRYQHLMRHLVLEERVYQKMPNDI